jgi:Peptidase family M23
MPRGAWDTNGFPTTWWDVDGNVAGWWDKDAIPFPAIFGDEAPLPSNAMARRTAIAYQAPSDDFVPTTFAIDDEGPVNLAPVIYERAPEYIAPEDNITSPLFISDDGFVPRAAQPFHIRTQFLVPTDDVTILQIVDESPPVFTPRIRHLLAPYVFDVPEWVPPKPVPPRPPRPLPQRPIAPKETGGNAVFITGVQLTQLPKWMLALYDEPKEEKEVVADLAIMHVTAQGAAVKAIAAGTVETHVDAKGRESVVLNAEDGTRYWYADVGTTDVKDGAQVKVGDVVAHTKSNARPLPDMIAPREGPRLMLKTSHEKPEELPPTKPAQIVFVEPPREEMYPATKKYVRLVPLAEAPPLEVLPSSTTASNVLRALVPIGVVAAILWAVSLFEQRPKPKKPKKKRKRKR